MRCPDCCKMVSYDEAEPEDAEVNVNGTDVSVSVRITNNCADCGTELKEANFELEGDFSEAAGAHECTFDEVEGEAKREPVEKDAREYEAEVESTERTSRSGYFDKKTGKFVNAGGRYAKTFYGVSVEVKITCSECNGDVTTLTLEDDVQASGMDELV